MLMLFVPMVSCSSRLAVAIADCRRPSIDRIGVCCRVERPCNSQNNEGDVRVFPASDAQLSPASADTCAHSTRRRRMRKGHHAGSSLDTSCFSIFIFSVEKGPRPDTFWVSLVQLSCHKSQRLPDNFVSLTRVCTTDVMTRGDTWMPLLPKYCRAQPGYLRPTK